MGSIQNGIIGLCVGDALGVPVEFRSRQELKAHPVCDMTGYGTYHLPPGSWSDDSSLTFCLAESLAGCPGPLPDYEDIMDRFLSWKETGAYTPYGETFDIGNTTALALERYRQGVPPLLCGGNTERDNGNGSLMRILPVLYYLNSTLGPRFSFTKSPRENEAAMEIIHQISALTHAHPRSQMACGVYLFTANVLLVSAEHRPAHSAPNQTASFGRPPIDLISRGILTAKAYYQGNPLFEGEIPFFSRIFEVYTLAGLPEDQIQSSGYVIHTLEAALWCLLTTDTYAECVLKAVNLGSDTDTVSAVAGGLAGLWYGYDQIPAGWRDLLARKNWIQSLCQRLENHLGKTCQK